LSPSRSLHGFAVGDVYSFKTVPVPLKLAYDTHRFAALKVIALKEDRLYWAVLDGIFGAHPTLDQVASLPWLRQTRGAYRNMSAPASSWSWPDKFSHPPELRRIGSLPVASSELALVSAHEAYSAMESAAMDAEGEWRWRNDRAAYERDIEEYNRREKARREEAERHRKERMSKLTWDTLLQQTLFERWKTSPPFPPEHFAEAARERIRTTIHELRSMGAKPRRAQVRKCIRSTVEWFNEQDAKLNHVIETEEREDICLLLEDIVCVARQPSIADEIGEWRTW
jgi:hypothetical protein